MSYTIDSALTATHAEVKSEIARTDTKASLLLAFNGAVLAGIWSVAGSVHLSTAARIVGAAGVVVLLGAVALLLRTVRPNLGGAQPAGFPRWATLTAGEIADALEVDGRAEDIAVLSRIAVAKFQRLRCSIDWTLVGGVLLVVAAVVTWVGAS
ncbi:integral membrane plasmid transfer protein [Streptomyces sp. CB02959]|uniref:Pycsar system effector family protein n=1 Tax=Streptomyces sp. CB02959 TaxID=2020330 RepID=UPI000C277C4B|nr:Pycsar system effector family protein [Streptomyces sp. CB02959]PJN40776.1 integral membrane plasmid transfer protein [Streptomyces sp. CB02959]